jgi:ABC-type antimicrobial peptide transport system permease subunit
MTRKPVPQRILTPLVAIALALTVSLAVVLVVAGVLGKMGDATGQSVLDSVALGLGVFWLVDIVCLVLALGVNSLVDQAGPPDDPPE